MTSFDTLAEILGAAEHDLRFTMLDIGALPFSGVDEPYRRLLDVFPGSQIVAFELDAGLCRALNAKLPPSVRYHAVALGRAEETRPLYHTVSAMCTSLYRPNEALLRRYHNLDDAMLRSIGSVETMSLDRFAADHGVLDVDFVKIDVQGGELDVFEGGTRTLRDVAAIVTEVEFVPLYIDQPLFGDVSRFLSKQGFMFHKFLDLSGRALRPTVVNNDPTYPIQLLWSDAVFIPDLQKLAAMPPPKLLKLAMLAQLYASPDLTLHCLELYDERRGTQVLSTVLQR